MEHGRPERRLASSSERRGLNSKARQPAQEHMRDCSPPRRVGGRKEEGAGERGGGGRGGIRRFAQARVELG